MGSFDIGGESNTGPSACRILVTRPAFDQQQTCEALKEMGCVPVNAPVMALKVLDFALPDTQPSGVIVTSRNGLRALDGSQVEALRFLPFHCVGARTAELARTLGFEQIVHVAETLDALTAVLRSDPPGRPARLLYLAGRKRSGDLADRLKGVGIDIELIEVYDMVASEALSDEALQAIRDGALKGVLLYSRRSADLFQALIERHGVEEAMQGVVHYCLSASVAEPLRAKHRSVLIANAPNEQVLLACVKKDHT